MTKILLGVCLALVSAWAASAQTVPTAITKHLNDNYSGWKQAPGYCGGGKWLLTGDFNGDGRTDYLARITTGTSRDRSLHLIGFINKSGQYTPDAFYEEEFTGDVTRSASGILKKGTVVSLDPEGSGPTETLKADALTQYICETDASLTYTYAGGEFRNITADRPSDPVPSPSPAVPRPTPSIPITLPPAQATYDLTGQWRHFDKDGKPVGTMVDIRHSGDRVILSVDNTEITGAISSDRLIFGVGLTPMTVRQNGNVIWVPDNGGYFVRVGYTGPLGQEVDITDSERSCRGILNQRRVTWPPLADEEANHQIIPLLCLGTRDPAATVDCFSAKLAANADATTAMKACSTFLITSRTLPPIRQITPVPSPTPTPAPTPTPTQPRTDIPDLTGTYTIYRSDGSVDQGVGTVFYENAVLTFKVTDGRAFRKATSYVTKGVISTGWNTTGTVSNDGKTIYWSDKTRWVRQ